MRIVSVIAVVFYGALIWTIAKYLNGGSLGAAPTLLIVGPFLYWAHRVWRSHEGPVPAVETLRNLHTEQRLEDIAANPELPEATREEAKRRLAALRSEPSNP